MLRNDARALDPLVTLTAANIPRCLEAVQVVRGLIPELFPAGFGDDDAAQVLGALNTNSHEVLSNGTILFAVLCWFRWRDFSCDLRKLRSDF